MHFDMSQVARLNVIDCCALWNLISSELLFHTARRDKFFFCITHFVFYEALLKRRSNSNESERQLVLRLKKALDRKDVNTYHLSIEDLQEVDILEKRRRLGKGELSSIAFAKRTRQAFMTDDRKALKLANEILGDSMVQTTPRLVGWLCYTGELTDSHISEIVAQHTSMERPLKPYFEEMYKKAMERRLMDHFESKH
jgi:hypothetical protein